MLSLASTTVAVEVFVSCDSMRVDADVKNSFFVRDRGCLSREAFLYLREGTGHANRFVTSPDTT